MNLLILEFRAYYDHVKDLNADIIQVKVRLTKRCYLKIAGILLYIIFNLLARCFS